MADENKRGFQTYERFKDSAAALYQKSERQRFYRYFTMCVKAYEQIVN